MADEEAHAVTAAAGPVARTVRRRSLSSAHAATAASAGDVKPAATAVIEAATAAAAATGQVDNY